ncbi:MAG: hypothetical protein AMXMBFR37_08570 [Steroidobacteraceae bacterium]
MAVDTDMADGDGTGVMRVRMAVAPLDSFMRGVSRRLELRRDPATGAIVAAVRDLTTGHIVRQMPPATTDHGE